MIKGIIYKIAITCLVDVLSVADNAPPTAALQFCTDAYKKLHGSSMLSWDVFTFRGPLLDIWLVWSYYPINFALSQWNYILSILVRESLSWQADDTLQFEMCN